MEQRVTLVIDADINPALSNFNKLKSEISKGVAPAKIATSGATAPAERAALGTTSSGGIPVLKNMFLELRRQTGIQIGAMSGNIKWLRAIAGAGLEGVAILGALELLADSIGKAIEPAVKLISVLVRMIGAFFLPFMILAIYVWTPILKLLGTVLKLWLALSMPAIKALAKPIQKTEETIFDATRPPPILKNIVDKGTDDLTNTIGQLKDLDLFKQIQDLFGNIKNAKGNIDNLIKEASDSDKSSIIDKIRNAFKPIMDGISGLVTNITSAITNAFSSITSGISSLVENITTAVTNAFTTVINTVSGIAEDIKTKVTTAFTDITDKISGIAEDLKTKAKSAFTTITDKISGIANDISKAVSDAFNTIVKKIKEIIEDVKSAPANAIKNVTGLDVGTIGSNLIDRAKSAFGDLEQFGNNISGIISNLSGIANSPGISKASGGTNNIVNHINIDADISNDIDIKDLADKLARHLQIEINKRSSYSSRVS